MVSWYNKLIIIIILYHLIHLDECLHKAYFQSYLCNATDLETEKKIKADVGSAREHPSSYPTWQPVHMATES